jgi:segregation and condensation protein A
MSYEIRIDNFEGPLDLLLHLIRKNEMEIADISIAEITHQYLAYLDTLKSLNLEVAGEFLVMAATLLHIKSRMLLPPSEEEGEEEEEDPRAELVRRLLEYQVYKNAAEELEELPQLGRDFFVRNLPDPALIEGEEDAGPVEVGIFELVDALRHLLQEASREEPAHFVVTERLSVTERIHVLLDLLSYKKRLLFQESLSERPDRHEIVVTFLALLELVRLNAVRFVQDRRFGPIWIYSIDSIEAHVEPPRLGEDVFGYG